MSERDPANVRRRYSHLARDRAVVHSLSLEPSLGFNERVKIGQVQISAPILNREYEVTNISVKKISRHVLPNLAALGARIRAVRQANGLTQKQFAERFGVTQGAVSNWEKGVDRPGILPLAKLAGMTVNEELRDYFRQESRLGTYIETPSTPQVPAEARPIPMLRDAVAAGTPRAIDESEIAQVLMMPKPWFPASGELFALRVAGDSMAPIIGDGYIVIVDTSRRDPRKLVERMVAAREGDGVTIKWLRKDGSTYLLVPQHVSPRIPVRIMRAEGDFSIVGEVVKWIGQPVPVRK